MMDEGRLGIAKVKKKISSKRTAQDTMYTLHSVYSVRSRLQLYCSTVPCAWAKGFRGRKEKGRIQGGKGAVPHPRPVKGGRIPPRTQSFHSFQILNWRVKNIKKVCCSFSALRRLCT